MIPELPKGRELVIDIKSTWGDRHYVGLNGVEVFTSTGEPAPVSKVGLCSGQVRHVQMYLSISCGCPKHFLT